MKETIYAEEFGIGLQIERDTRVLRVTVVQFGNSPNETREIASATIADYRVKKQLLPLVTSASETVGQI